MTKYYNSKGIGLAYTDSGNDGIPIIFIHGFPFDKSSWDPQVLYLKEYYRVITIDLRGFGQSGKGNEELNIDLFADDIIRLMDELTISDAIICGLSMGGYIALNIVERYKEKLKALVLADTHCNADSLEAREKRFKTIKDLQNEGLDNFANTFIKNVFTSNSIQENKEYVEQIKTVILSTHLDSIIAALKALANRKETCSILSTINIPVLIICGAEDGLTPPERSLFMHKNIPNSIMKLIENAAHVSNLEQSGIFNKTIKEFLSISIQ